MGDHIQNRQMLKELSTNKDLMFDVNLKLEQDESKISGVIDAIIKDPDTNKKMYLILKSSDTLPALMSDVLFLNYIRIKNNEHNESGHEYAIYCEIANNSFAENTAKYARIKYIKNRRGLKKSINTYFRQ